MCDGLPVHARACGRNQQGSSACYRYVSIHATIIGVMGFSCQDRAELLKRWVQSGENLSACEHEIIASRRANLRAKRTLTLVSVKDMSKPPHNFSEHLGLQLVYTIWQDTVYCILCAVCTYTQSGRRLPTSLPTSKESKLLSCRLIS